MKKLSWFVLCITIIMMFGACEKKQIESNLIDIKDIGSYESKIIYETVPVLRQDLKEEEKVFLKVIPMHTKTIEFDRDVTLKSLNVRGNKMIKQGTLILEVENKEIDREINLSRFLVEEQRKLYQGMSSQEYSSKQIEIQKLDLEILEVELNNLLREKEKMKIYAETDCYISGGRPSVGRNYKAGSTILELSDSKNYVLETGANIDMSSYKNVKIDDRIRIKRGRKEYWANVIAINKDEHDKGKICFEDKSNMDFSDLDLKKVILEGVFDSVFLKDTLTIKLGAIHQANKKNYVEVLKDGVRRIRYVKLGAVGFNANHEKIVQILSGLKEGETVIIGEMSKMEKEFYDRIKKINKGH